MLPTTNFKLNQGRAASGQLFAKLLPASSRVSSFMALSDWLLEMFAYTYYCVHKNVLLIGLVRASGQMGRKFAGDDPWQGSIAIWLISAVYKS